MGRRAMKTGYPTRSLTPDNSFQATSPSSLSSSGAAAELRR